MKRLIQHIFKDQNAQLAVLPEFVSFLSGRKKIVRIVVDRSDIKLDKALLKEFDFYVRQSNLYTTKSKNSYSCIVASPEGFVSEDLNPITMYSISKSVTELNEFEDAELYGETEKAGEYLGYPACCVESLENINQLGAEWALFYLEDFLKKNKASMYCNRFPIVWGGVSVVGELFPCSLNCNAAKTYGQNMLDDMDAFGFKKIKEAIVDHSKRSVFVNKEDGEISVTKEAGFEEIVFS